MTEIIRYTFQLQNYIEGTASPAPKQPAVTTPDCSTSGRLPSRHQGLVRPEREFDGHDHCHGKRRWRKQLPLPRTEPGRRNWPGVRGVQRVAIDGCNCADPQPVRCQLHGYWLEYWTEAVQQWLASTRCATIIGVQSWAGGAAALRCSREMTDDPPGSELHRHGG